MDYESIPKTGAIVGSGGMIVMDEDTCMVDMARFFLDFTRKESCGKCNYCRIGTKRMLEILERITRGEGRDGDIELLEELAAKIKDGSMCGLGQTAPNPVLTTLRYFRNEYEDHIYKTKVYRSLLQGPDPLRDHRLLQGVHPLRPELPRGGHHRRREGAARHRPGEVHQVRQVYGLLQTRRHCEGLRGGERP